MAEANRAFAGARCLIHVDGLPKIGWGTGISGTVTQSLQRVDVLNDIRSQSIEPVGLVVQFTIDFVRILKKSLVQMGVRVQGTTAAIIGAPPFNIDVFDSIGEKPLYRITGVRMETLTFRVDARSLLTTGASFQGTDFEELVV